MDAHLCNKHLLLKHGGDCVARQINFPLPHTHLVSHVASIQPLLSPLASADWLTYGIALFCFSSPPCPPPPPSHLRTKLCILSISLLVFFLLLSGKESTTSFFYISDPLNQRDVSIWCNTQVVLYMNSNTQVRQCFVVRPPWVNSCYCPWSTGVLPSRESNAGIFNS